MKGLELSRRFYEAYGPELLSRFPGLKDRAAAGLAGEGSECFGYDDELSRDHDFGPDFCIWLSGEDWDRYGEKLTAAYRSLPGEFLGIRLKASSAGGGGRRGPARVSDFYRRFTGGPGVPQSWQQWLYLPEYALACAVNGVVFQDGEGEFTRIRAELKKGYPRDIRIKKMAAAAVRMAQSGQYNFSRCMKRGEKGGACLALGEFARSAAGMIALLNQSYLPYYKWMFRRVRELPVLGELADSLEFLLAEGVREEQLAREIIEDICGLVIGELKKRGLAAGNWDYLEPYGLELMEQIENPKIRALHVLE